MVDQKWKKINHGLASLEDLWRVRSNNKYVSKYKVDNMAVFDFHRHNLKLSKLGKSLFTFSAICSPKLSVNFCCILRVVPTFSPYSFGTCNSLTSATQEIGVHFDGFHSEEKNLDVESEATSVAVLLILRGKTNSQEATGGESKSKTNKQKQQTNRKISKPSKKASM